MINFILVAMCWFCGCICNYTWIFVIRPTGLFYQLAANDSLAQCWSNNICQEGRVAKVNNRANYVIWLHIQS